MTTEKGYHTEPLGRDRRIVAAASAVNREHNAIHLLTEVDITEPRRLISRHFDRTGERLSLTGYITTCLARTLEAFPQFNAFRKGSRLIVLHGVAIGVLVEREVDGRRIPEPLTIQAADRKTCRQVNEEIRTAQRRPGRHLGTAPGSEWIRLVPGVLLRTAIRLASRSVKMKQRYGVVAVTAVGMFGRGPMWPVPLTSATVTVAVGAIGSRPLLIEGALREREHLALTVSFNHDIVDGAPAARFVSRFTEILSSGDVLREEVSDGDPRTTEQTRATTRTDVET